MNRSDRVIIALLYSALGVAFIIFGVSFVKLVFG